MAVEVIDEGLWVFDPKESGGAERDKWVKGKACLGHSRGKRWGGCGGKAGNSGGKKFNLSHQGRESARVGRAGEGRGGSGRRVGEKRSGNRVDKHGG